MKYTGDFDVLMSIYNGDNPSWLNSAFESVLIQSANPKNFILVLDGGVDQSTQTVISSFLERAPFEVKVLSLSSNLGLAAALHEGLKLCMSPWVIRCDADDINRPDRFKILIEASKNASADVAVIGSSVGEFIGNPVDGLKFSRIFPDHSTKFGLMLRDPVAHPAVMFRLDAVNSVGGYIGPLFFEDTYLWLRLLKSKFTIINVNLMLLYQRIGDDFYSRRRGVDYIMFETKALHCFQSEKLIPFLHYIFLLVLRIPVRIFPIPVLRFFYGKYLR